MSSIGLQRQATKETPVYIKSDQHVWVPALQVKTDNLTNTATVFVPNCKNEQDMLTLRSSNLSGKQNDQKVLVDLKQYPNNVLPMQNVNANTGNLEDYKDMVNLPFLHEVGIVIERLFCSVELRNYIQRIGRHLTPTF
jgi:hypothetical protein